MSTILHDPSTSAEPSVVDAGPDDPHFWRHFWETWASITLVAIVVAVILVEMFD